jgi:hypothetical protein
VRYCRLCLQLLSLKVQALNNDQRELLEYSDTFLSSGAREFHRLYAPLWRFCSQGARDVVMEGHVC